MPKKKEEKIMGKFQKTGFILLIFSTLIIYYGVFVETKMLNIKEYAILNEKITETHHGLKIVHFSDLHYGTTIKLKELKKVVMEINMLNPDIIVFTGDLVDENQPLTSEDINDLTNSLNNIIPGIPLYLVKGNHDNIPDFDKIIDKTNFIVLNNSAELFYHGDSVPIQIIGLDSYINSNTDIDKAFSSYVENLYTILLTHEPDNTLNIDLNKVDLILSGHSHNGQVRIPFVGAVITARGAKTYYDEKYLLKGAELYISGGIGTSHLPFRLLNPPSMNFYRLYNN